VGQDSFLEDIFQYPDLMSAFAARFKNAWGLLLVQRLHAVMQVKDV
jgi:hypothetical protein